MKHEGHAKGHFGKGHGGRGGMKMAKGKGGLSVATPTTKVATPKKA